MRLFEGTEFDRPPRCEQCGALEEECSCPPPIHQVPPEKQTARLAVEKRKRGKSVTVVRGISPDETDLTKDTLTRDDCAISPRAIKGAGGPIADVSTNRFDHGEII